MPRIGVQIPFRLWHNDGVMIHDRRSPPPLDGPALEQLALRYVERFATTRARLAAYLGRKVRERGWAGPPVDPGDVAQRFADLGYIDDRLFAEARARSLGRRGLGAGRVRAAFRAAGISEDDALAATDAVSADAVDSALILARRKRIGPYADAAHDRRQREKQLAQMIRGGHSFTLARRIVDMAPGDDVDLLR